MQNVKCWSKQIQTFSAKLNFRLKRTHFRIFKWNRSDLQTTCKMRIMCQNIQNGRGSKHFMRDNASIKNTQKCSNLRREVNGQRNCESGNKGRPQIMWRGRKHRPSHAHQILNYYYCGNNDLHYKGGGGQNPISWTSNSFSSRLQLHTWFVPNFDQYLACKSPFWLHNLSSIIFQVYVFCVLF